MVFVQERAHGMITRRNVVRGLATFTGATFGLGGYAVAVEPRLLGVTHYAVTPPGWPKGLHLRIAVLADVHACEPWMSVERIAAIAERANALNPDLIVLLGDYTSAHKFVLGRVRPQAWAEALAVCKAPLGVHAVLGNHDWWDDRRAMAERRGPIESRIALERAGVPVYENEVVRLSKGGRGFWIAGLADQMIFAGRRRRLGLGRGLDDLPGTLAQVRDDAPVILLAHEPDVFTRVPDRVALTLSGHTHGGQIRIMGYAPVVPSDYRSRFAYGHVVEQGRNMIVSGGLGCSIAPVRIGVPPEIVMVEMGAPETVSDVRSSLIRPEVAAARLPAMSIPLRS
jgi:hypothetical protein